MTKTTAGLLIIIAFTLGVFSQRVKTVEKDKYVEETTRKKNIKNNNLNALLKAKNKELKNCKSQYNDLVIGANTQISKLTNEVNYLNERLNDMSTTDYQDRFCNKTLQVQDTNLDDKTLEVDNEHYYKF